MSLHGTIESPIEVTLSLDYSVEPGQETKLPDFSDEVGEPGYGPEAEILQLNSITISVPDGYREITDWKGDQLRVTKHKDMTLNLADEVKAAILQALLEVPHLARSFADEAIEAEADQ